jgi:pilus assembly protein Flp/PilA
LGRFCAIPLRRHGCRNVKALAKFRVEVFAFFNGLRLASRRKSENVMRPVSRLAAFFRDDSGATAIEYGLMAACISVVILVALNALGSKLNSKFDEVSTLLQ